MKKITTLFCLILVIGLQWQAKAADAHVNVADFAFTPQLVTINVGESVTWHWVSGTHPTQSDSNPAAWSTFTLGAGNPTFSKTFTAAGTYPYHCTVHGFSMSGVITVTAATGINKDQPKNNVLEIYPNPATTYLKIALNSNVSKTHEIKIINAIGKTVKAYTVTELNLATGTESILNIGSLPAGLYFINLLNNDKILESRRLVIIK